MKTGLRIFSFMVGGLGTWAISAHVNPWVAVGVVLLIWSNNIYMSTADSASEGTT